MHAQAHDDQSMQRLAESYASSTIHDRAAIVNRMMRWLLLAEWVGMVTAAFIISPRVWNGSTNGVHPHLWGAILAGPAFILPAIIIAFLCPAGYLTRHVLTVAQMLVSVLLIDCTGGRIETHFHVFGSLALLAFYMDWRVLATATVVTAADHFARGVWWPQSVYGVLTVSPWRWVEHAGWVVFEDFFLVIAARQGIKDVYTMSMAKALLYQGASHDVLTGLANRRMLEERFDAWETTPGRRGAILFVDLDRFKQANDTLGHTVGDKLLALVAARLEAVVGNTGMLARIGGDEFIVLLEEARGVEDAESLGQGLIAALATPFRIDEHELFLSASIGISLYSDDGRTLAALQERADRAMYVAKSQGRNRCVAFSAGVSRRERTMMEVARDLSGAIGREEFHLCFQPLIQRNGRLAGFEALLRWHHPLHGIINPADFIPLAEKSGMIIGLGHWVLIEACRQCQRWQRQGQPEIAVAVNVSAVQFGQADYPDRVFAALAQTELPPSLLTLEITESVLARDMTQGRAHLSRIRLAGVRVALDDFGTGYSSLSYLAELPADLIKLDRSFVNSTAPDSGAIIESVVTLAHRLGMQVVAEGVETDSQLKELLALQCDQLQGFYFSKPITARDVMRMLDDLSFIPAESFDVTSLAALAVVCDRAGMGVPAVVADA